MLQQQSAGRAERSTISLVLPAAIALAHYASAWKAFPHA
jgi:hypothetical protein